MSKLKKIGIMQPYFFPYLGYFMLVNAVDIFVLYDDVSYIKGGWINRNKIKIAGKSQYTTIPVTNASTNYFINEVKIVNYSHFKKKFLKTLEFSYRDAPYYTTTLDLISLFFSKEYQYMHDLNESIIRFLANFFSLSTDILISSKLNKNNALKGEEKVIDICQKLGGNTYINPFGGMELYNKKSFLEKNLKLKFLKMRDISYYQGKGDFLPNLSIIDVLMFNSREDVMRKLNAFELI